MNGYNIYTTDYTGSINISTYSQTVDDSIDMDIDSSDEMNCFPTLVNPEDSLVCYKWFQSDNDSEPISKRICRKNTRSKARYLCI